MHRNGPMPSFQRNDPDQMFVCPFDPVHRVTAMRLPYHIKKCARLHPLNDKVTCPFNARHVVQGSDLEKHLEECVDRQSIAQDFVQGPERHGYVAGNFDVPEVDFEIGNQESWDNEIDESVGARGINFDPVDSDAFEELRDLRQVQQLQSEVLSQPTHVDLSGMSAAARKNYKRSQKRKQQAEAAAAVAAQSVEKNGIDEEEYKESEVDAMSAEELRKMEEDRKLEAIRKEYLQNGKASGSFVDYKSILNIYCQKKKINLPSFREASGVGGGYGAECIVQTDVFRSKIHAKRKKDAYQDAAKQALLGLNIDIGPDPTPCRPAHMRTEEEWRRIRELDEMQRSAPMLHQPRLQQMPIPGLPRSQLVNQVGRINQPQQVLGLAGVGRGRGAALAAQAVAGPGAHGQDRATASVATSEQNGDDDWTVVSGRRGQRAESSDNPVFQHSLKLAGRGRGRLN